MINRFGLSSAVVLVFISTQLWSQCPDSLLLSSQIDIDNFEANYGQCSEIQWLIISGDDIQNLEGLSNFKELYGNLSITDNPLLSSLTGLDSLEFVEGSLYVANNDLLNTMEGLASLRSVSNEFIIVGNPEMVSVAGLDSFVYAGALSISNPGLLSLNGLEHLARAGNPFFLKIEQCPRLKSLSGLDSLKHLYGLTIARCDSLTSLNGLQQLMSAGTISLFRNAALTDISALLNTEVSNLFIRQIPRLQALPELQGIDILGQLLIFENDSLRNVDGLSHVTEIGTVQIDSNPLLENILGLSQVEFVGSGISIRENPNLEICNVPFLCDYAQQVTDVNAFQGNGTPCVSAPAILAGCQFEGGSGSGLLYLDMNCDQEFDSGDFALPHYLVERTDVGAPVAFSDIDGIYWRYLRLEDTITFRPRDLEHFVRHPVSHTLATGSDPVFYDTLDFALCPDSLFHAVGVTASPNSNFVRGFNADVQVCASNSGTYPEGATLQLDFENFPNAEYVDLISADGDGVISGGSVEWDLQYIIPFQTTCFRATIRIDPGIDLGSTITAEASITPDNMNGENPSDNVVILTEEVVGSFDPNDKRVDLERIPESAEGIPLEYTIRFQNTGTFPATFIEVRDTLPAEVDLRTFEMLAASHDYVLSFPEPRVLHWLFDPINLLDSMSNEPASHGFIRYRIQSQPELQPGVEILNAASIYFDFNAPVHTANAVTIVEKPNSTGGSIISIPLSISPNPARDEFLISYEFDQPAEYHLRLTDVNGTLVHSEFQVTSMPGPQSKVMSIRNLPQGVYLIQLVTSHGVGTVKVVIGG